MSILKRILKTYKSKGLYGVKYLVLNRISSRKSTTVKKKDLFLNYFTGKKGIEIGGPSDIFSKEIPIYQVIDTLDGCNFSTQTVWEGNIEEGENFNYFENKKGFQYICEASNLALIPSEKYDFLIASHCLEHCANTLKTMKEWLRVVKKGGCVLLILPDKRYTFDHNRSVTAFEHFKDDLKNDINEKDLTHLTEILKLHDLKMDSPAGSEEQFKKRSLDNYKNRCLHHHIFDFKLLQNIYFHFNIKIVNMTFVEPYHQIILGIKQ
jgi:SAM-dependent methyltransferase